VRLDLIESGICPSFVLGLALHKLGTRHRTGSDKSCLFRESCRLFDGVSLLEDLPGWRSAASECGGKIVGLGHYYQPAFGGEDSYLRRRTFRSTCNSAPPASFPLSRSRGTFGREGFNSEDQIAWFGKRLCFGRKISRFASELEHDKEDLDPDRTTNDRPLKGSSSEADCQGFGTYINGKNNEYWSHISHPHQPVKNPNPPASHALLEELIRLYIPHHHYSALVCTQHQLHIIARTYIHPHTTRPKEKNNVT